MTDLVIDFSNVTADEFTEVPPGKYEVTVDQVTLRSKDPSEDNPKPSPYLNWTLSINDGEFENRKVWTVTSFSPAAIGRTKACLETFGVDVTGELPLKVDEEGLLLEPNLEGEPAVVTIKMMKDKRDGETRARVTRLIGKHAAQVAAANGAPAAAATDRFK